MSRYEKMFARIANKKIALIPFITAGYPSVDECISIVESYFRAGADAIEIGLPFSDPVADGLVIQQANKRALSQGACFDSTVRMIRKIRSDYPDLPIGIMTYANVVFALGLDTFYSTLKSMEVDSCLIPDLPIDMADEFIAMSEDYGISQSFIVPHNATDELAIKISQSSKGFNYITSRKGVTGEHMSANNPLSSVINSIKRHSVGPPIVGFGISSAEDIKHVKKEGAVGAVIGSAVINIIEQNINDKNLINNEIEIYLSALTKETFY